MLMRVFNGTRNTQETAEHIYPISPKAAEVMSDFKAAVVFSSLRSCINKHGPRRVVNLKFL